MKAARERRFKLTDEEQTSITSIFDQYADNVGAPNFYDDGLFHTYQIHDSSAQFEAKDCITRPTDNLLMKGIYWNQENTGIRMIDAILYSKGQFSTLNDNTVNWTGGLSASGK